MRRDEAVARQDLIPLAVSSGLRELRLDGVDVRALGFDFDGLSGLELPDPDIITPVLADVSEMDWGLSSAR